MTNPRETNHSRREMFRGMGRVAILGAFGALSGALLLRRGEASPGHDCRRRTPCSRCGVLASCRLPRALSEKRSNTR